MVFNFLFYVFIVVCYYLGFEFTLPDCLRTLLTTLKTFLHMKALSLSMRCFLFSLCWNFKKRGGVFTGGTNVFLSCVDYMVFEVNSGHEEVVEVKLFFGCMMMLYVQYSTSYT